MKTASGATARDFYIGLAIGQILFSLISTAGISVLWIFGQNPAQVVFILAGIGLVGGNFLVASLTLLRMARRLPDTTSPEDKARSWAVGRNIRLRFGLIVLTGGVVIGIIDVVLGLTNHSDWIALLTSGLVGLSFVPLALRFQIRSYLVLGLVWIGIVLLTIVLTSARLMLGQGLSAWVFFPLAGCGLATWVVTAFLLRVNLRRIYYLLRQSSPT